MLHVLGLKVSEYPNNQECAIIPERSLDMQKEDSQELHH
jgi:hypothetical protein